MKRSRFLLAATAVTLMLPLAGTASAGKPVSGGGGGGSTGKSYTTSFQLPVKANVAVGEDSWCDNSGPHITLYTDNMFDGLAANVLFSKNKNDAWHNPAEGESFAALGLSTGTATAGLPKQPPLGGVGGNPFIYIQPDASVEDYYYIGRCVQDGKIGHLNHGRWSVDTNVLATLALSLQALDCSNKGSSLSLGTETSADAPTGNIVMSNSDMGLNPQHIASVAGAFGFALGQGLKIKKGGGVNGVGGNPYIATQLGTVDSLGVFSADASTFNNFGGVRCNKI
ncbi:MAG: hypothetical protein JJD92_04645 [Frankiaceae bacterium]|nr:hypothetical protein [Frankiaceae bacterium]